MSFYPLARVEFRTLLALTLALAQAPASLASERSLSLEQAQKLALTHSRQLPGQDHTVHAAREMAVAAGQLPDPVLKMGIDNLPLSGPDRYSLGMDFMTMRRIGLMQELPRAEKLRLRSQTFEIAAQKSLAEKSLMSAAIQRESALAWLERYYLERMTDLLAEQLELARLDIAAAHSAYRSGRGSQADLFSGQSGLALLQDRQDELQVKLGNSKTSLMRWVGPIGANALDARPDLASVSLDATELTRQTERHPQLQILARQEQLARNEASLAQANQSSDWSVEVVYQQRGSAYPNMLSVGVSVPWQWDQGKRQNRELASKLAMTEQAKAEREEGQRALLAETQNMLNEWHSNRRRLMRFQNELIPFAQQRSSATLAAYRGAKASLSELFMARRAEVETRLQNLQLEADTDKLWAQLEYLTPSKDAQ